MTKIAKPKTEIIKTKDELFLYMLKNQIDDTKYNILKLLNDKEMTPLDISKALKISPPLTSYHLNGNSVSSGLIELGFVKRTHDEAGIVQNIQLTLLGLEMFNLIKKDN